MTTITLTPELETAIAEQAHEQATTPETLVLDALRQRLDPAKETPKQGAEGVEAEFQPRNAWEALILSLGFDAGISLTDEQVSREVIYEDHD